MRREGALGLNLKESLALKAGRGREVTKEKWPEIEIEVKRTNMKELNVLNAVE